MSPFDWGVIDSAHLKSTLPRFLLHALLIYIGVWLGRRFLLRRVKRLVSRTTSRDWVNVHTNDSDQIQTSTPDARFQDQSSSLFRTSEEIESESNPAEQPFRDHRNVTLLAADGDAEEDTTFGVKFGDEISTDEEGSIDGVPLRNAFLFMRLEAENQQEHIHQQLAESSRDYIPIGEATLTPSGDIVVAHISETAIGKHSSEV